MCLNCGWGRASGLVCVEIVVGVEPQDWYVLKLWLGLMPQVCHVLKFFNKFSFFLFVEFHECQ